MFTPFPTKTLTQTEYVQFYQDVIEIFRNETLQDPLHEKLETQVVALENKHTGVLFSFKPLKKSDLTVLINKTDKLRGTKLGSVVNVH